MDDSDSDAEKGDDANASASGLVEKEEQQEQEEPAEAEAFDADAAAYDPQYIECSVANAALKKVLGCADVLACQFRSFRAIAMLCFESLIA